MLFLLDYQKLYNKNGFHGRVRGFLYFYWIPVAMNGPYCLLYHS
jgi:hypothetical protein